MSGIGGNCEIKLFKNTGNGVNRVGEKDENWVEYKPNGDNPIMGWLDLSSGSSFRETYNAKVQESSHVFICDYVNIEESATNLKAECKGKEYDVLLIDNPMELNEHLEIFLKYVGD